MTPTRSISTHELGESKLEPEVASVLGSGFLKNASAMMLDFQETHTNTKDTFKISKVFTTTYYKCIFYWGGLIPNEYPDLHPGFAQALANLPENFDKNNPDPFYSFFEDYGTHYIHHVTLGAQLGQVF